MNDDDEDGPVGYGHPPRKNRWPKGKSGNPNGRPKKAKKPEPDNAVATLLREIDAEVIDTGDASYTRLAIELRTLSNKAIKDDMGAQRLAHKLRKELGIAVAGQPAVKGGVLIVPAAPSLEEWEKRAASNQRRYREGPYPRYDEKADDEESGKN